MNPGTRTVASKGGQAGQKPACRKCLHYFVTWDKAAPHGCKALGFKSRRLPLEAVRASTPGMDCQMYVEKKAYGS